MKNIVKILAVVTIIVGIIVNVKLIKNYNGMIMSDIDMFVNAESIEGDDSRYLKVESHDDEYRYTTYVPYSRLKKETIAIVGAVGATTAILLSLDKLTEEEEA